MLLVDACGRDVPAAGALSQAADRRGSRRDQRSGSGQRHRAGADADRDREAGHVSAGDRACRHAGLEKTRSFSRNGFAQITAVFTDRTDIYFARQQVAERLTEAKANIPPGAEVKMGPISTGLGEIYWWAVEYAPPEEVRRSRDGEPGWQSDGSYLTPEGERLTDEFAAHRLPAHGAGLDHPAANEDGAGGRWGRRDRRLRQAISRYSPIRCALPPTGFPSARSSTPSRPTTSAAAPTTSSAMAKVMSSAPAEARRALDRNRRNRGDDPRRRCPCASRTSRTSRSGANCGPAAPA